MQWQREKWKSSSWVENNVEWDSVDVNDINKTIYEKQNIERDAIVNDDKHQSCIVSSGIKFLKARVIAVEQQNVYCLT
jgi:hypothetical protein